MADSSSLPSRTSMGRDRLAAVLRAAGQLVTVDAGVQALGLNRIAAAQLLARWAKRGWLRRVRRGLYAPVPLAASAGDLVIEDPWILVPSLFDPGYVGGASAAHHWDLTEQLFRTVFVFTARPIRRTEHRVCGTDFSVHHVPRSHLFGTQSLWRGRVKIQVSDVHRTVVDMLADPAICGGARHSADCVARYFRRKDADGERLMAYADRLANGAVFKRLGFLAENRGGPAAVIKACRVRLTAGYARFDPSLESTRLVSHWRLRVPRTWKTSRGER